MADHGKYLRSQSNIVGDVPAERQILLLKLVHEFENPPPFGSVYQGDASSPPQLWISRIGALLSRVSLQYKIAFQSTKSVSAKFWGLSRESFRRTISEAIEEIKLELELEGRDEIGQVYEKGKEFDFFTDLKGITSKAQREVFIVDTYFDASAFLAYFSAADNDLSVRILCGKPAADLSMCISKYESQTNAKVEVRKTREAHDRLIFIDSNDCWIVGASIKDAGKKPTYLIPFVPQLTEKKLSIYEKIWSESIEQRNN